MMSALWQPAKSASDDNLIPLINIVFLLLIFFMVAGQVEPSTDSSLALPVASHGQAHPELQHQLAMNAEQVWLFDGEPVDQQKLIEHLDEIDVEATLSVLLHRHLTAEQIQPLLTLLRQQQISHVRLISQAEG